MFGVSRRKTRAERLNVVTRQQLLTAVAVGSQVRPDHTHLYLMLEEGGVIGVQWEFPGGEQLVRYRVADPQQGSCPHCAALALVDVLSGVLPFDQDRAARTRAGYEMYVRMGKLPAPAFAVRPDPVGLLGGVMRGGAPTGGWVADVHASDGDPHTGWDCPRHRA